MHLLRQSDRNMNEVLGASGYRVELIEYEPDLRPKRFYYRKCGMQVGPWPSDEKSQAKYLSKGFLLEPPELPEERKPLLKCQICGVPYENLADLISCLAKHKKEE